MKSVVVLLSSLLAALAMLIVERVMGVAWDFHPDAVTYATLATDTVRTILANSYFQILNNGYYFWAAALNMNVALMTFFNMIIFAYTNLILYRFHEKSCVYDGHKGVWLLSLAILMFNPYRLHLATTILKDTMILLFVVVIVTSGPVRLVLSTVALLVLRIASILYLVMKLRRKQLFYFLGVMLVIAMIFSNEISDRLMDFNNSDMRLRDFDRIPNFRDYGLFGVLLRGASWPLLAVSGLFAILSPALAFTPVAIGSVLNQAYVRIVTGRFAFPLGALVPMVVFATLVTGYTAYIRYVYPILVVLPILAVQERRAAIWSRLQPGSAALRAVTS